MDVASFGIGHGGDTAVGEPGSSTPSRNSRPGASYAIIGAAGSTST
jgi:hypothetical protein